MSVFANGREVSSKASQNKTIAAMPDVCLSPPGPPAGPVPIPYPNTSMATDTADGSKTVFIGGKQVGLKNASVYKKSTGNEPATNSFGAGVVSHVIQGKTKFAAWSFDVKFEGHNAIRHLDLTTTNHVNTQNTGSSNSIGRAAKPPTEQDCKDLEERNKEVRTRMAHDTRVAVRRLSPKKFKFPASSAPEDEVAETANTIAHAAISGASKPASRAFAASRHSILAPNRNHATYGGLLGKDDSALSTVCGGGHQYKANFRNPPHLHSEARILESIQALPGARPSVTFSIDWRNTEGRHHVPCEKCETLIKHACKCMDIYVCTPENEPERKCPKKKATSCGPTT
jgi:Domain of unknown function (DUF4150)